MKKQIILLVAVLFLFQVNLWADVSKNLESVSFESGQSSDKEITNSIGMKLVLVEKGIFDMGSNTPNDNAKPIHTVNITKDFYIGQYEVTNEQFIQVFNWANTNNIEGLKINGSSIVYNGKTLLDLGEYSCYIAYKKGFLYVKEGKEDFPCVYITRYGAIVFTEFLNKKEGLNKYRLPTEAEWEYAVRGGSKSKDYKYSGSNNIKDVAWYNNNSRNKVQKVGLKKPNELGIYDMTGNVGEWIQDYYSHEYYANSPKNDPVNNNSSGSGFIVRGGSVYSFNPTIAGRYSPAGISKTSIDRGFRIAKTL